MCRRILLGSMGTSILEMLTRVEPKMDSFKEGKNTLKFMSTLRPGFNESLGLNAARMTVLSSILSLYTFFPLQNESSIFNKSFTFFGIHY